MTYQKQFGRYKVLTADGCGDRWFKDHDKAVAYYERMACFIEEIETIELVDLKTGEILMQEEYAE